MTLAERILALHAALTRAGIAHAFGGAIALAYWTLEPRGTRDLDLNLFVSAGEAGKVLGALPPGVAVRAEDEEAIARDGQVRLWWEQTPLDLFFDYLPIHAQARRNVREVAFEGSQIPVLGPIELAVFKVMFDRTRDWADIEAMIEAESLDVEAVEAALSELVDRDDPRFARLEDATTRIDEDR